MSTSQSMPLPHRADRSARDASALRPRPEVVRRDLLAEAASARGVPPPVPPFSMRRERLERLLDGDAPRPVILVRGPAGAGKSVLVAQWVQAHGDRCAWLPIEVVHNDADRLLRDLVAVVEQVGPAAGARGVGRPPVAGGLGIGDPWAALDAAVHGEGGEVTLVLDDVHHLHDLAARRVLAHLVEHPPEGVRIVLISRSKPQLGLARARLRGDLTEVSSTELRFQRTEIDALVSTWTGRRVDPAEVEQATLGWAAGLRLAQLEASAGDAPFPSLLDPGGFASEYVNEELVESSTAALRTFLDVTCWLPLLTPSLCTAVVGGERAPEPAELAALPTVPIASRPGAFRYPPILTRVLQRRQLLQQGPDAAAAARRQAADACRQAGELLGSLRLFFDAGCDQEAAEVCAAIAAGGESALRSVHEVLANVGDSRLHSARWLPWRVRAAVAAGRLDEARQLLERSDPPVTAPGGVPLQVEPHDLVIARAMVAERAGDVATLLTCADHLLEQGEDPGSPARGTDGDLSEVERARAWQIRAHVWSGDLDRARQVQLALDHGPDQTPAGTATGRALALAWLAWADGDIERLAELIELARPAIGDDTARAAELALLDGAARRELGRLARAVPLLDEAATLAGTAPHHVVAALAASELARCRRVAGATMEALELAVTARARCADLPTGVDAHLDRTETWVRLDGGDTAGARAVVRDAPAGPDRNLLTLRVTLHDAPEDASAALERIDPRTPRQAVEKLLLAAQIPGAAAADIADALLQAVSAGSSLGLVRTFLDEGPAICRRLSELARDVTDRSIGRLAALACQELAQAPGRQPAGPVEPLTPRELAVLRMLPLRLSNREMAEQMYVSVNTVKTHIRAIYRKLEVPHRSEAVRRARALQLV